jgi:hypothetical protein
LNLQAQYDLRIARDTFAIQVNREVVPLDAT